MRSAGLAVSGWVALASSFLPTGSAARGVMVVLFLLWAPGAAAVRFWPSRDRLERAVLSVAVSAALAVLLTEAQLFSGLWQPHATLAVLAAATTGLVLAHRRRQPVATGGGR